MKSVGKARNNGLYRHIRTSKEIIRNLLNDYMKQSKDMENIRRLSHDIKNHLEALKENIEPEQK